MASIKIDQSDQKYDGIETNYDLPSPSELILPSKLKPLHYDLLIKTYLPSYVSLANDKKLTFDGKVVITIKAVEPAQEITLNMKNITLISTKCDVITNDDDVVIKEVVELHKVEKVIFVLSRILRTNEEVKLKISYVGPIGDKLGGFYQSTYNGPDGKTKIAAITQFEPTDARLMVPCFDEPQYKANWTVTVIHPTGTKAISNCIEISEEKDASGNWITTKFKTTPRMSSYLLAIFVSEFDYIEQYTKDGIRFRVWSRPEAKMMTQYALAAGIRCLQFYEEYYKIKYPLEKQDMVALPDFGAGAMENWGLITYRENLLLYDVNLYDPLEKQRVAVVVAHELAHQWFGNLVTMQWWDDLWLNEGFATMVEYIGADEISSGQMRMKDFFLLDSLSKAFNADSLASSHPVSLKIERSSEINEVFDSISYDKGASLLVMLSALIGEDKFQKGVTHYLKKFSYNNAQAYNLWNTFDEVINDTQGLDGGSMNITEFANQWTTQIGYPILTVECYNFTTFKITQQRYKKNKKAKEVERYRHPSYGFKWDVPVWYQIADEDVELVWLKRDEPLYLHLTSHTSNVYNTSIVINANRYGFYRQNYDSNGWTMIINQLNNDHEVFSARTRNAIISDVFAAAKVDMVQYETAFQLLSYLTKEKDYLPWAQVIDSLMEIVDIFGNEPESKLIKNYTMGLLKKMYVQIDFDEIAKNYRNDSLFFEISRDVKIIKTYCYLGSLECKKKFRTLFNENVMMKCQKNDLVSHCVSIAAPLRSNTYCYGVQDGDDKTYQKVMDLYKAERVQKEKNRLLNALGCHNDVTTLKTLLQLALDRNSSVFRLQDVAAVFETVSKNPIGREFMFSFLIEKWESIYKSLSTYHSTMGDVIASCTKGIRTMQQIEQLKSLRRNGLRAVEFGEFDRQIEKAEEKYEWMKKHSQKLMEILEYKIASY